MRLNILETVQQFAKAEQFGGKNRKHMMSSIHTHLVIVQS